MIQTRRYLLALGDLLMMVAGLTLMLIIRFGPHYDARVVGGHATSFAGIFALWLVMLFVFNLYEVRSINPNPRTIGMLAAAMCAAIVLGGFIFYVHPHVGISPRTNLLIVGVISFGLIVLWRRIFYKLFTTLFPRSIVLIGVSPEMEELKREIDANPELGIVRAFWKTLDERTDELSRANLVVVESHEPKIFVTLGRNLQAEVHTLVDAYQEFFARIPLTLLDDTVAVRIASKTESYGYRLVKRVGEILISLLVLVVSSPFMLVACLAKYLEDGGPVLLKNHKRTGQYGRVFDAYKIRSMVVDADKNGSQWTTERDPRITPVGRVVRKLHLDEVPQFWNIVKGDMSLIGPRPEQPKFVADLEREISYYYLRQTVKPGFTGWAQIKFRYARTVADSAKKWEYDLYYLANRSLLLDIGIVLKTIQIVFTH